MDRKNLALTMLFGITGANPLSIFGFKTPLAHATRPERRDMVISNPGLTQSRNEAFFPISRTLVTWPHKNQFFSHNSPGLDFYPTSCGVIRNQRQKYVSTNLQISKIFKYKDFWKFLGEWFSICVSIMLRVHLTTNQVLLRTQYFVTRLRAAREGFG